MPVSQASARVLFGRSASIVSSSGAAALALKFFVADCDVALQPAINSLGDQVMLGIARALVVGNDGLRAAVGPFDVGQN
jgi:hypothetical protein